MKYFFLAIAAALLISSCSSAPPPKTFSVNLESRNYGAGETEAYFEGFLSLGGLKKTPMNVYYYPDDDAVCLQFKLQYVVCSQFWDKSGRDAFVSAFKLYQEEYEQKKLGRANRKTRGAYGSVYGFFTWKKTVVSSRASGNPRIDIGYQFRDNAVFFTTTQAEVVYEEPLIKNKSQTTTALLMYFTRAQTESLVQLFSQEFLQGLEQSGGAGGYRELDGY